MQVMDRGVQLRARPGLPRVMAASLTAVWSFSGGYMTASRARRMPPLSAAGR
jgi:hypothetical protein